mgnify:FL=1
MNKILWVEESQNKEIQDEEKPKGEVDTTWFKNLFVQRQKKDAQTLSVLNSTKRFPS